MKALSLVLVTVLWAVMLFGPMAEAAPNVKAQNTYSSNIKNHHQEGCDCCIKCRAATKDVKGKQDGGQPAKNGCRRCCNECGETNLPLDQHRIPEKIK